MKRNLSLISSAMFAVLVLTLLIMIGGPAPALAQQGLSDMKGVFGDDMVLDADTITMDTAKDGKLDTLIAKRGVVLTSKNLNVNSDLLTYSLVQNRLVATGQPVKIRKEDVRAICKNFEYFPKDGKAVLTGDPHVWQKNAGKESEIIGRVIKMIQRPDGRQSITIESGTGSGRSRVSMKGGKATDASAQGVEPAEMDMVTDTPAAKPKKTKRTVGEPVSIDSTKVDKIPEPSIGE